MFIALHRSDEIFALPEAEDVGCDEFRRNLDDIAKLIRAKY